MLVFKFGGASVKDADAVRNVAAILAEYKREQLVVVVSAMGKTTNALEAVVDAYMNRSSDLADKLQVVREFHEQILDGLGFEANHPVRTEINNVFVEIDWVLEEEPSRGYGYSYDQIVAQGELLSTRIVSAYLEKAGYANTWLDARDVIQTDNNYYIRLGYNYYHIRFIYINNYCYNYCYRAEGHNYNSSCNNISRIRYRP